MSSSADTNCPNDALLGSLAAGDLNAAELASVEEHLSRCAECCARLDDLSSSAFNQCFESTSPSMEANEAPTVSQLVARLKQGGASSADAEGDDEEIIAIQDLGNYEQVEEVARGGMGIVLRAFDPELQRRVAIKTMAPGLARNAKARERFLSEARAAAKLQHENILPVHAVDQSGAVPYLVTPLVDGNNLQERLEEGNPLPIDEVISIGFQLACALTEAHRQGLVHRDVKPSNVLLLDGGRRVWLADFGLAVSADEAKRREEGLIAGTPSFMAPEQVRGEVVDHRSDLFALGCVLYAMVDGSSPFDAGSPQSALERIIEEDPPRLRSRHSSVPRWFDQLVDQLLAKDPNARPQNAALVKQTLERHLHRALQVRLRVTMLVMALVLVTACIGAWLWIRPSTPPPEGFLVSGQESKVYATLAAAIDAADRGDVVIVRKDGLLDAGRLTNSGKAITIRAAQGMRPVFESGSEETIFESDGPIALEGLEFRHPAGVPNRTKPVARFVGGPIFIANCKFVRLNGRLGAAVNRFVALPSWSAWTAMRSR